MSYFYHYKKEQIMVFTEEMCSADFFEKYKGFRKLSVITDRPKNQKYFSNYVKKLCDILKKKNYDYYSPCFIDNGVTEWTAEKVIEGTEDTNYGEAPVYKIGYAVYAKNQIIKKFGRSEFKEAKKFAKQYTYDTGENTVIKKEPFLVAGEPVCSGFIKKYRTYKKYPNTLTGVSKCTEKHLYIIIVPEKMADKKGMICNE